MIRVLIADDSATARAVLRRAIASAPDLEVAGEAATGQEAVEKAMRLSPDVITMDVFMPMMDGCAATREIMARRPIPILAVTAYELKELGPSFDALAAGALGVIRKPAGSDQEGGVRLAGMLLEQIRQAARTRMSRRPSEAPSLRPAGEIPDPETLRGKTLLIIGGSAGAPGALCSIVGGVSAEFPLPMVIVQHMQPAFQEGFAQWLGRHTVLPVQSAEAGRSPLSGCVYLPPPDRHLGFDRSGCFTVEKGPPVKGHRPSIDFLFQSAAQHYGGGVVAILLSGMGDDGAEGAKAIGDRNGLVLVQNPGEALVAGIPQAAVDRGAAHALLSTEAIRRLLAGMPSVKGGLR